MLPINASALRPYVHIFQSSGYGCALCRRQYFIDIGEQLRQTLGGPVGELQMRYACRFQRRPIHRVSRQSLQSLFMGRLQLRMHRQQVVHGLLYERSNLRLLRLRSVDLDVQMLQHVINVRRDVGSVRQARHAVMKAAGPNAGSSRGRDAANQGRAGEKGDKSGSAKDGSTWR